MKWEQDLIKDVRYHSDIDDQDLPLNPQQFGLWDEVTDCNRESLYNSFMGVRDQAKAILEIGISRNEEKSFTQVFLKNKKDDTIYIGVDIDDKSYLDNKEKNIHTIKSSSSDFQSVIKQIYDLGVREFDYIFIDGWHSINQVLMDWEYTKILSDNGIVGFHDTNHHPGPSHFINNLNRSLWKIEKHCPNDWGIGFAFKRKKKEVISLIETKQLIEKYKMNDIKGVIHVGAHHGEEISVYYENGIENMVLFEPLEENFEIVQNIASQYDSKANIRGYQVALGSVNTVATMYLSSNELESSSILEPKEHLNLYPDVKFSDVRNVDVRTLDSYNINDCNMLNMDVQGYELEVLKGSTKTLGMIDYIYTEVNNAEIYKNNAYISQIDEFLFEFGFKRVETSWWGDHGWGDAFYVKEK